ncbi:unnamed protein product [Microthlaspi erraticum]|uniref:F-box domain-containing protein n=1 Tax=Microthlaspi erraticum TaxID=1685480 RepID=A0A6D2I468_9BRAS|nr:unnamed protein product [Microthlaspi erraticum]
MATRRGMKGIDRISELPDPLICQILSYPSVKDAVRTSVLSTRWRSLWLWVPNVVLYSRDFPDLHVFKSFGDRFFNCGMTSCIQKLQLSLFDNENESYLTSWIDAASKRKLRHLDVWCVPDYQTCEIPISVYTCETLVTLNLCEVILRDAGFVSLPCLKTMRLRDLRYPDDATFERLVSCSPVLEELEFSGYFDVSRVFRVHTPSLKSLKTQIWNRDGMFQVVIDAPQVRVLTIYDNDSGSYIIKNLSSSFKLDILLSFGKWAEEERVSSMRNRIRHFLPGISNVGEMKIYVGTVKVFGHYFKFERLPQFYYLSRLVARVNVSDLKWLPTFLQSCPNIKFLAMSLVYMGGGKEVRPEEVEHFSFSYVPECSLSSLESVDIQSSIRGTVAEMKLVRYFLENSIILKTLTLDLKYRENEYAILKELLNIPRRSITCQVLVR